MFSVAPLDGFLASFSGSILTLTCCIGAGGYISSRPPLTVLDSLLSPKVDLRVVDEFSDGADVDVEGQGVSMGIVSSQHKLDMVFLFVTVSTNMVLLHEVGVWGRSGRCISFHGVKRVKRFECACLSSEAKWSGSTGSI
jgi:hypothetical protein